MSDEELGGGQRRGAGALRGMRSEEDWQRLVVEFKATGLSARAFGQPRGVAPSTFLRRARRILNGQAVSWRLSDVRADAEAAAVFSDLTVAVCVHNA